MDIKQTTTQTPERVEQIAARNAAWEALSVARAAHDAAMDAYRAELREVFSHYLAGDDMSRREEMRMTIPQIAERHDLKRLYDALQAAREAVWGTRD